MKRELPALVLLCFATILFAAVNQVQRFTVVRIVRVITADTFTILYKGKFYEVRLIGVNAPETDYNDELYQEAVKSNRTPEEIIIRGKEAVHFVESLIQYGSQVRLEFDRQRYDRYGRWLCYLYLKDGRMLNLLLLKKKLAELEIILPNIRYRQLFLESYQNTTDE